MNDGHSKRYNFGEEGDQWRRDREREKTLNDRYGMKEEQIWEETKENDQEMKKE